MSVLIKGVNAPIDCTECVARDIQRSFDIVCRQKFIDWRRPDDCPIMELQDHGVIIYKETLLGCLHEIEKEEEHDQQRSDQLSETDPGQL